MRASFNSTILINNIEKTLNLLSNLSSSLKKAGYSDLMETWEPIIEEAKKRLNSYKNFLIEIHDKELSSVPDAKIVLDQLKQEFFVLEYEYRLIKTFNQQTREKGISFDENYAKGHLKLRQMPLPFFRLLLRQDDLLSLQNVITTQHNLPDFLDYDFKSIFTNNPLGPVYVDQVEINESKLETLVDQIKMMFELIKNNELEHGLPMPKDLVSIVQGYATATKEDYLDSGFFAAESKPRSKIVTHYEHKFKDSKNN